MGFGVIEGKNEVKRFDLGTSTLEVGSSEALEDVTVVGDRFSVGDLGNHLAMIHILPGSPNGQNGYTLQLYNNTLGTIVDSEAREYADGGMQVFLFTFNVTNVAHLYEVRLVIAGGQGTVWKLNLSPLVFKMAIMPMNAASSGSVSGSGTAGYITKWTAAAVVGNSIMSETGTQVTTAGSINLAGANTDTFAALKDGQNVPVSAANEGRLRYNGATGIFQASVAGGAWVTMVAGAGVANRVTKWTNAASLGSSQIIDTGSQIQMPIAPVTADADADILIQSTAATQVPLVVQGYTAQSDNLTEWHDAAGANLAKVAATGAVTALDMTVGLGSGSGADGKIVFANTTNANTLTIQSGVTAATHVLTLPLAQGGANTFLRNNGSGVMSWAAGGASGAGTLNVIPKVTNGTGPVYGDSSLTDDGTTITTAESIKINSNTSVIKFGTAGDVCIGYKATNTIGIGDGGTSDAIRISAAGRIYGNAVANPTPNVITTTHVTDGTYVQIDTNVANNLVVGQTVTLAGWTWNAGGGVVNGTWLVTALNPAQTWFRVVPTTCPTTGSNPTVVGTVTVAAQIQMSHPPVTADATCDVMITANEDTQTPLVLQGHSAGQSVPLQEWQASDGTVPASMTNNGTLTAYQLRAGSAAYFTDQSSECLSFRSNATITWLVGSMGSSADLSLSRKAANVFGIGDGGTSDAIRISSAGRIYGNAVANPTPSGTVADSYTDGTYCTIKTTAAHNLCAGQTVTLAGWTWNDGGGVVNGTWLVTSVASAVHFVIAPTSCPTSGTNPSVVGTVVVSAQLVLGALPVTADADADVLIQATAATQVPLVVQGYTAQSDNLTEWHSAAGTTLAKVAATGAVTALDLTVGLGSGSGADGNIVFANTTNANTLTIQSGVTAATHALTLPLAQGSANTFLCNNGAGVLSWEAGGASGSGTLDVIPKITNATGPVYGDSSLTDDGTTVSCTESIKLNSDTAFIQIGTAGDIGFRFVNSLTMAVTNCMGVGGASEAIHIDSGGRIWGFAVPNPSPSMTVGDHTTNGTTILLKTTSQHMLSIGQVVTLAGWTWSDGGGSINLTYLVNNVPSTTSVLLNPATYGGTCPTNGTNPSVVGTITVVAQLQLGNAPAATAMHANPVHIGGVVGLNSAAALGYAAVNRISKTINISGLDCARKDDGQTDYWLSYGSRVNIIYGPEVDFLAAPADYTATVPSNCKAWVEECGWIQTLLTLDGGALTVQPTVRFGVTGTLAKLLAAQITTLLTAAGTRERYTTLLTDVGETTLTAGVTIAGTIAGGSGGEAYKGRPYWVVRVVENE
jgi:hypothetical protein